MNLKRSVVVEGYRFELAGSMIENGSTTLAVRVTGAERESSEVYAWAMEVIPDEKTLESFNVTSCEKRTESGEWAPAVAQNTSYELTGESGVSGALIEGFPGACETAEYKVTFEREIKTGGIRIICISGDDVYRSAEALPISPSSRIWAAPVRKPFCLYIVVSEGYKPAGACRANVSIMKRGVFLVNESGIFEIEDGEAGFVRRTVKAELLGSVKITATVPLKSSQACGDTVEAYACDCFELCETIGYSNEEEKFELRDVSICPVRKSLDLTLLNAHCGKSVYRLDGEYIIDCKRCL